MNLQADEFLRVVGELEQAGAWEKVPPEEPYGSLDAMFLAEIGVKPGDGFRERISQVLGTTATVG